MPSMPLPPQTQPPCQPSPWPRWLGITALAVVAALILLFEFFWEAVIIAVLVAGAYIMWENLRELRG